MYVGCPNKILFCSVQSVFYCQAVKDGDIKCNFQGFAMGDSWIVPVDSTFSWSMYCYGNVSKIISFIIILVNSCYLKVQGIRIFD